MRKSRELCISIKLQHDSIPDLMITNVEDGDDAIHMGDVVGMITGDVLEVDVEDMDCSLLYNVPCHHLVIPQQF